MLIYFKHDVILIRYPFSDLLNSKVRPAVVVSAAHVSQSTNELASLPILSKCFAWS